MHLILKTKTFFVILLAMLLSSVQVNATNHNDIEDIIAKCVKNRDIPPYAMKIKTCQINFKNSQKTFEINSELEVFRNKSSTDKRGLEISKFFSGDSN